ncbi:hypothetical protein MXB_608 [Myxobolus squamalis]|nr:hypothetical protein MXB_608 [Myxobolus squamalis]
MRVHVWVGTPNSSCFRVVWELNPIKKTPHLLQLGTLNLKGIGSSMNDRFQISAILLSE